MAEGQYFVRCMLVTGAQSTCICLAAAKRKKEQLAAFVPELNEMMEAGCSGSPVVLISITLT